MEEPHSDSPLENAKYTDDLSNYLYFVFCLNQSFEIINDIESTLDLKVLVSNSAG
jgi:hypothetical protein